MRAYIARPAGDKNPHLVSAFYLYQEPANQFHYSL
jgi:hypothetical protein